MSLKDKIMFDSNSDTDFSSSFEVTTSPSAKMFSEKNKNVYLQCLMSGTFLLGMPSESKAYVSKILSNDNSNAIEVVQLYNDNLKESMSFYLDEVNNLCLGQKKEKHDIIQEVLSFKSLSNNWDGFGAIPAEIQSASNVLSLIDLIGEVEFCKVSEMFSNPNGTISLIWTNKSEETISLDVGNNRMSYYIDFMSKETLYIDNVEINKIEAKKITAFIQTL